MNKWQVFGLVVLMMVMAIGGPKQSNAQSAPDRRFGMTEVFWLPGEAKDLGVGWERILFYWREVQPEGPGDWNTLHVREEWLAEAEEQGREVVGLIKNTAPWASTDGSEAGVPKGLYLPVDDPENLWANYVRRLASYYGERNVHHWIIWNEPEIEQDVYGFEFAGSTADYYQLLKTAYKVMKEADPEAVIHLAGLTWWHDPAYLDRLLALAAEDPEAADYGFFFDVISLHVYFRTETVKSLIEEVEAIQGRYGLEKPIWINETNAPPNRDPEWPVDRPLFNVNLDQQAWYIMQAIALGFASGAERISVYKLLDIQLPPGGESFGLVRPDTSRRPAYDAYKLATRCLGSFTDVDMQQSPTYYQIEFERNGSLTHVAWARTPAESLIEIPATTESATMVRLDGTVSEVLPTDGSYALQLSGQVCDDECLIGGEPVLLVEAHSANGLAEECTTALLVGSILAEDSTVVSEVGSINDEGYAETESAVGPLPTLATTSKDSVTESTSKIGQSEPDSTLLENQGPVTGIEAERALDDENDPQAIETATLGGNHDDDGVRADNGGTIGLWFLATGIALAVVVVLYFYRTKINPTR